MKKVGRIVKTVETSQDNPRNGEGSFIRLNDGGVMLAYSRFGGEGGDHDHSRIVGITSYDEGETWSGERELFNDDYECRNNMACAFVRMPNGEIGACYLRKNNEPDGTISCMPVFRYSSDEGKSWSKLVFCTDEIGYYCGTNAASVVTSAGRIITPVSFAGNAVHRYDLEAGIVRFFCSDDCGRSWHEDMSSIKAPYGDRAGLQEPGVLELPDETLWCHMRTVYGFQYQSFSKDGGKTWTVPEPALLFPSPDSPMRVNKLGAKVIAVFNPVGHSPYAAHNTPWGAPQRTPIMLAVSGDGGLSFAKPAKEFSWNLFNAHRQHCFLMEGDPADSYCYPAMIRVNGGYLVTYYCDAGSHRVLNCSHVVKITDEELTPL